MSAYQRAHEFDLLHDHTGPVGASIGAMSDAPHGPSGRAARLLFPIQWPEPFGLVMTEAMACGTPVVAWRNGSVPEVVAGLDRVGDLDPHAMRSRVQERFSAEAMVAGYEHVYQRILASGDEASRVLGP